jgi:hypothetical protein
VLILAVAIQDHISLDSCEDRTGFSWGISNS